MIGQLDTRIPLGIEQPNILAALSAGTQNAANQASLMRQAEGQNVFRQYGAGAMRGDPAALNALAGFDPTMAQGMRLDQRQDARADASLRLAQEAGARAAREAQDSAAAMAEAQQAQGLMKQLAQAYATGNEQAFGALSAEIAGQPLPMEPQSLQTLDAFITGFSGGLSSLAPQQPEMTAEMQNLTWRASEAGLQPGTPEYQEFIARGGAKTDPLVNVDMGGGTDRQVFDAMMESATSARAAATGYRGLLEASKAIEAGAITGFAADQRLALQRLGALVGVADPSVIENTETFRAAIAPQVAALMKATVGSTQISNADREFAERAAGGSIQLNESTIKRLIGIMEKAARASVEGHMDRLNKVYPDANRFPRERALFDVSLPEASTQAPAPQPTVSNDLTPEEQSVFELYR